MTRATKADQIRQLAEFMQCLPADLAGQTFGLLLEEAERSGAVVYWGFWTAADLEQALVPLEDQ